MAAGSLTENFQNEHSAVIHWKLKVSLKVTLLSRTQTLIKQNLLDTMLRHQHFDLIGFTATDKKRRVWRTTLATDP
jgi:hypothetical protein